MGLRGLYQEAVAPDRPTLEKILSKYEEVLAEDPGNTVCVVVSSTRFLLDTWGADAQPPRKY